LAELTSQALSKMMYKGNDWTLARRGIYHLASADYVSRYDLACYVVQRLGLPVEVFPALTREFPSPVNRPIFSALSSSLFNRVFELRVPGWREMLDLALETSL
jgi:dTDP-4-dehydrorhamnose reductase